jgi:hypothetical protein
MADGVLSARTPIVSAGWRLPVQFRLLQEDGLLKSPQVRPWFDAQLLAQLDPQPLEGAQGVRLAAATIQAQHELSPAPLPQRLRRHRRLQVGHHGCVLTLG